MANPRARSKTPSLAPSAARSPARSPRPGRALRLAKWIGLLVLVLAAFGAMSVAGLFWFYGRDSRLPTIERIEDYQPLQVTVVLDGQGQRVGEIYQEGGRRSVVPYSRIPKILIDSFVAAEDDKFWEHGGIDYVGMLRALIVNLKSGKAKQGASTITQQVVKNLVLSPERTFRRKIQEVILARRLEAALSKEDILTLYVNEIYFGHGRYGVQEAARFYFGKDVADLNVGEAAVLAGLPQSPENNSPLKNPEHAKQRQTYVLNRLVEQKKLEPATAKEWIDKKIAVVAQPFPHLGTAPEWTDVARGELATAFGEEKMMRLGGAVRTTMDVKVQEAAQAALRKGLLAYDVRHKVGRAIRQVKPDKHKEELARLKKKLGKGGEAGKVYQALVTEVRDAAGEIVVDAGEGPATIVLGGSDDERFNPPVNGKRKSAKERFAVGDVVEVVFEGDPLPDPPPASRGEGKEKPLVDPTASRGEGKAGARHANRVARLAPGPEGAVVAMRLPTREVAALVGGGWIRAGGFNRALRAKRQPGSSFKPFVYAAAIDAGKVTPATTINDAPEVYDLWKPQNYKKANFEGPVRLRYALAKSINTVAIRVCSDIGPAVVAGLANRMGISAKLPQELSLALGSGEVTPLEMTNAMASFVTGGQVGPPRFIATVNGQARPAVPTTSALRPDVAFVVTDMMRSVVEEGTGTAARSLGFPVYGKTGTSNDSRDAWFIGMTSEWIVGVWLGYDDNRPLGGKETGGATAVPIFTEIAKVLGPASRPLTRPDGVVEARIDRVTGLLAAPGAPEGSTYVEYFLAGSQPTEVAPLPGQVDSDTFVTDAYGDEATDEPGPATEP